MEQARSGREPRRRHAPVAGAASRACPLVVFLGLAALFLFGLNAGDPSLIPSALIGHPAPQTILPPIAGLGRDGAPVPGLDPANFKGAVTVGECLGVMVRAVPRRGAAADAARARTPACAWSASTTRTIRTMRGVSSAATAIRSPPPAPTKRPRRHRMGRLWRAGDFIVGRDGRIAYKLVGPITPDNFESCSSRRSRRRWRRSRSGDLETTLLFLPARSRISSTAAPAARRTEGQRHDAEHLEIHPDIGRGVAPDDLVEHREHEEEIAQRSVSLRQPSSVRWNSESNTTPRSGLLKNSPPSSTRRTARR